MDKKIFINRRRGRDRREEIDPCQDLDVDLYHRKRRKKSERRAEGRSLDEDYYAYQADSRDPDELDDDTLAH